MASISNSSPVLPSRPIVVAAPERALTIVLRPLEADLDLVAAGFDLVLEGFD